MFTDEILLLVEMAFYEGCLHGDQIGMSARRDRLTAVVKAGLELDPNPYPTPSNSDSTGEMYKVARELGRSFDQIDFT